jgi:hypothetical protein
MGNLLTKIFVVLVDVGCVVYWFWVVFSGRFITGTPAG